jgi:glycosyltransferase involved in cell wall biosynthesis
MAYGRPAVVSDSGGNAELVADGESGIVVPINDPQALAAGIVELWSDPDKLEKFGRESKRRIRDIFNVEQATEKTLAVYRELVAED